MLPLHIKRLVLDINYIYCLLNAMFDMIDGLILVSHAPKQWYSAGGFWGCDTFLFHSHSLIH
ncbi:hypothetical protein Hanom_Chr06g00561421 [Helianthus anomalus]